MFKPMDLGRANNDDIDASIEKRSRPFTRGVRVCFDGVHNQPAIVDGVGDERRPDIKRRGVAEQIDGFVWFKDGVERACPGGDLGFDLAGVYLCTKDKRGEGIGFELNRNDKGCPAKCG
ncbi:hypothetical protein COB72_08225 [bacterium]|nr:MAG: hypothetical protein COB72_08225 [bacterium]